MFAYGLLTSWVYLRFYQPHVKHTNLNSNPVGNGLSKSSSGYMTRTATKVITRGDMSDAFAFETFFPNIVRPVVAILSNFVYNLLVRASLCPKVPSAAARLLEENNSLSSVATTSTQGFTPPARSFKSSKQFYSHSASSGSLSQSLLPSSSSSTTDFNRAHIENL